MPNFSAFMGRRSFVRPLNAGFFGIGALSKLRKRVQWRFFRHPHVAGDSRAHPMANFSPFMRRWSLTSTLNGELLAIHALPEPRS